MLLPDEQNVISWLTEYGPLPKRQVEGLLSYKPDKQKLGILRNMIQRAIIYSPAGTDCFALDHFSVPDDRMVLAVWVLLKFQLAPKNHFRAVGPSQIYFVKASASYEICVIYPGEEHLTKLLRERPEHKYILVIEDQAQIAKMVLPKAPCLFAVAKKTSGAEPEIQFIRGD